ncbi:MAG TPA: rhomboid family intramembrane serine protease [Paludibacter sp.]|jgi:membrane associated rhomboid family serine protease|nr:MAG: Rhomboid family protein [Bacteroidetes bacterium ADurb.Bin174]HQB27848.1 rhomboid family intramembrane serine protease [Paludibacter sp.]
MNFLENLKSTYKQGDAVIRLIYINSVLFIVLKIFVLVMQLFKLDGEFIYTYLAMPSNLKSLLYKPWTVVTYMFLHKDFFHIFFNMLALYWFGKLFLIQFTQKQLYGLYFWGGLSAGLIYLISYNIFPLFSDQVDFSILMGASGSIMAMILATAMQFPNMELRFFLIGMVKLKYIAIAAVLISIFGITSGNAGGQLAHLGGALYGYFFVISLRRGKDSTKGFNKLMDSISNLFKSQKLKVKRAKPSNRKMTDAEFNMNKAKQMKEIDRILDKIKSSGYGSLTSEEKKKLFEQGK